MRLSKSSPFDGLRVSGIERSNCVKPLNPFMLSLSKHEPFDYAQDMPVEAQLP